VEAVLIILLFENTSSLEHVFPFTFNENSKYKQYIKCYDALNNSATNITQYFVGRENPITIEWATILRPLLTINQTMNFKTSITNNNTLTTMNLSVITPNGTIYTQNNNSLNIASSIDEEYNLDFNQTEQSGDYLFNNNIY